MSPPRKDPIPNQYNKTLGIPKDPCLTPHVNTFPPGMKSLRNKENDDNPETTDTSRTDKDDTSRTNQDGSVENVEDMKNTNYDDECREYTSQHKDVNESVYNPETIDTSRN